MALGDHLRSLMGRMLKNHEVLFRNLSSLSSLKAKLLKEVRRNLELRVVQAGEKP